MTRQTANFFMNLYFVLALVVSIFITYLTITWIGGSLISALPTDGSNGDLIYVLGGYKIAKFAIGIGIVVFLICIGISVWLGNKVEKWLYSQSRW